MENLCYVCKIFALYLQIIMENKETKYKAKINVLIVAIVFLLLCMIFMASGTNSFYQELYYNTVRELEACNHERLKLQNKLLK